MYVYVYPVFEHTHAYMESRVQEKGLAVNMPVADDSAKPEAANIPEWNTVRSLLENSRVFVCMFMYMYMYMCVRGPG